MVNSEYVTQGTQSKVNYIKIHWEVPQQGPVYHTSVNDVMITDSIIQR
jgi:hypothetical protein